MNIPPVPPLGGPPSLQKLPSGDEPRKPPSTVDTGMIAKIYPRIPSERGRGIRNALAATLLDEIQDEFRNRKDMGRIWNYAEKQVFLHQKQTFNPEDELDAEELAELAESGEVYEPEDDEIEVPTSMVHEQIMGMLVALGALPKGVITAITERAKAILEQLRSLEADGLKRAKHEYETETDLKIERWADMLVKFVKRQIKGKDLQIPTFAALAKLDPDLAEDEGTAEPIKLPDFAGWSEAERLDVLGSLFDEVLDEMFPKPAPLPPSPDAPQTGEAQKPESL